MGPSGAASLSKASGGFTTGLTSSVRLPSIALCLGAERDINAARAHAMRKAIVDIRQDSPAPDFGRPHPGLPHSALPKPYASDD
jgi:hypothetical protein